LVERQIDSQRRKYQLNSWLQSAMLQIRQRNRWKLREQLLNATPQNKRQHSRQKLSASLQNRPPPPQKPSALLPPKNWQQELRPKELQRNEQQQLKPPLKDSKPN
jgi:hypothetical protein